jgi:hypothetical protein
MREQPAKKVVDDDGVARVEWPTPPEAEDGVARVEWPTPPEVEDGVARVEWPTPPRPPQTRDTIHSIQALVGHPLFERHPSARVRPRNNCRGVLLSVVQALPVHADGLM